MLISGERRDSGLGVDGLLEPFEDMFGDKADDDDVVVVDGGDDKSRVLEVFFDRSESILKEPFIFVLLRQCLSHYKRTSPRNKSQTI